MRQKIILFVAVALPAASAISGVPSANATGSEIRTVTIALSPENAAVAVNGHPRQHPNGSLELRGPLGAVFTVEAVANGGSIIERVAITDVGALPPKLLVPAPPPAAPGSPPNLTLPDALAADECAQRTYWDTNGVKHYKPQCLGLDETTQVLKSAASGPGNPSANGALTVVCMPKCDHIFDNGADLGPGHLFNRAVPPGMHSLLLWAPNGAKKTIVVSIAPEQTRELRVSMDPNEPKASADVLNAALQAPFEERRVVPSAIDGDEGFLTLASYPWTKVSENGRPLCLTPCVKIPLSPGVHVLTLENETTSIKQSASITIRGGEITVKRFAFK